MTVDFISEIISCNRDKNSKILTGDPEKVKKYMILGDSRET